MDESKLNFQISAVARTERKARGLQQSEVVEQSGGVFSVPTYSQLERTRTRWNSDTIEAVARGLGITTSTLLRKVADRLDDADPVDRDLADDVAKCLRDRDWHGLAFIGLFEMARAERAKGTAPAAVVTDVLETSKEIAAVVIEGIIKDLTGEG